MRDTARVLMVTPTLLHHPRRAGGTLVRARIVRARQWDERERQQRSLGGTVFITLPVPSVTFTGPLGRRNSQSSLWSGVRANVDLPSNAEPMLVPYPPGR